MLCGCSAFTQKNENNTDNPGSPSVSEEAGISEESTESAESEARFARPFLIESVVGDDAVSVSPNVAAYEIKPDLSNVVNYEQFYFEDEAAEKLSENGFVVYGSAGNEFFEIYEMNRYSLIPNFITVDSLMHTYHLYFAYLMKNIERDYLSEDILQLSNLMLNRSIAQYEELKGSEWENAARRNVAFFTVGAKLLDDTVEVNADAADMVSYELDQINQAEGIQISEITGDEEDYSQYIPRGYYAGDETLERYFKAMMWYGRIHFPQKDEDMTRSALLITEALAGEEEAYEIWESVYAVTSFFAGASDDRGVCEYAPIFYEVYGEDAAVSDLTEDSAAFEAFRAKTADLPMPQINSIPIEDGEENTIPGFRFMGQRFTVDASIMQRLIYSEVGENAEGEKRMLPDALDVPAALGSETALRILEENDAAGYAGYSEHMEELKTALSGENEKLWSASLYAGWLNTLRPLLEVKGEGYPVFMQNEEWTKKNLESFAGSFTELKHDTILYSKQVLAEMGGGEDETIDDRGYAEPEPLIYARFAHLAAATRQGLEKYGMLSEEKAEDLTRLSDMAEQLREISEKELRDEVLTEEEYEFIEAYGGSIEHFWYEAVKEDNDSDFISAQEYPGAVVVDIATDPNGQVLEIATGNPSMIDVVVEVDGKIKIARGSVYSFYQFAWPLSDRLTDLKWCQMLGIRPDENGDYNVDPSIRQPEWTDSYRYRYEY